MTFDEAEYRYLYRRTERRTHRQRIARWLRDLRFLRLPDMLP